MARPDRLEVDGTSVRLQRSARRRRTIQARREEGGGMVLLLPQGLSDDEERHWARTMVAKVVARETASAVGDDPQQLERRAAALARRHLDPVVGHPVRAQQVKWVTNQNHRWGSCSPDTGVIRLSHRLQRFPAYVVDHVIVHELVHLVETNHTARFHELVARHPETERAKGFLEGWTAARSDSVPGGTGDAATEVD